ncbi:secreted antigen 1 [Babesia divergens]|uniref:Secreted antigen 1 n=1 Tax=Babesia divergens TaxID=32595 RepID=A0AAD9G9M4_BABDI|nr:secreted antigen 1 [Babesia divergens]
MKFLGILRASALCLLVSGFHGPRGVFCSNLEWDPSNESFTVEVSDVSEDHEDSTVESSSELSSPAPKSNLVFQSSEWNDSHLASAVFFLEEFCQEVRADAFSGSPFDELYEGMKEPCLRVSYYARSYTDHFRPRNLLDGPYKDALKPEMFKYYVGWLKKNIPGIIGSLEHLFNEFKGLSEKQLINDASFVPVMYGFEFHDAWTDKDFMSSLRHKTSNLVNALKSLHGSLGKIHSDSFRNPLTEAQSNLVFQSSEWDDSHLASSVLFLKQFCKDVKGGKFDAHIPTEKIKKLDKACSWVSYYVDSFSWRRVRGWDENPYEDALKPEKFKDYAEWLVKNLPVIRTSMINMYNESIGLTEEQLETATSSGPYKYGFVHTDNWWRVVGSQFFIYQLVMAPSFLQSFKDLKSSLEDILNGPEEYTVKSQKSVPEPEYGLVFESSTWDDSMLASTFLFIKQFCRDVGAKKFDGKLSEDKFKDLSEKCEYVSSYMGSFIHRFKPTYGPGSVTERKEIPMDFYKDVLKPEDFDVYAEWIVKNIPVIRVSLKHMYYEALKLSEKQLNEFSSYGPPKYGFVYTGYWWGELTHGVNRGFFGSNTILESFKDLKSSLDDILGNSITSKVFSLFSREQKSDVNSQQENSTVKSQAA